MILDGVDGSQDYYSQNPYLADAHDEYASVLRIGNTSMLVGLPPDLVQHILDYLGDNASTVGSLDRVQSSSSSSPPLEMERIQSSELSLDMTAASPSTGGDSFLSSQSSMDAYGWNGLSNYTPSPSSVFSSTVDFTPVGRCYWMTDMWDRISDFPLNRIRMPGSHNAGMYLVHKVGFPRKG